LGLLLICFGIFIPLAEYLLWLVDTDYNSSNHYIEIVGIVVEAELTFVAEAALIFVAEAALIFVAEAELIFVAEVVVDL